MGNVLQMNNSTASCIYQTEHQQRFEYTVKHLAGILASGSVVADIGCHRLDQGVMLAKAGFKVIGFDVLPFLEKRTTITRARQYGIQLAEIKCLERGEFSPAFPNEIGRASCRERV